jgi:heme a synthase
MSARAPIGTQQPTEAFHRFTWGLLVYTLVVILFGAWVRITGSGAGCGQHWPTCKGEVVHLPASVETLIELTHRVTSGANLILVIVLVVLAVRRFAPRDPARTGAWLSLLFIVTEALLGASLVLLALVGVNDSIPRAVMMSLHLANTSLLTGAIAYTAWASGAGRGLRLSWRGSVAGLLLATLAATILTSGVGAVTALGDTLYPVTDSGEAVAQGFGLHPSESGVSAHFLQRMRIVHPAMAVALGLWLFYLCRWVEEGRPEMLVRRWATAVRWLVGVQLVAGFVNIGLSAPGWMQIVHLCLAVMLWIALVFLTLAACARSTGDGVEA